MAKNQFDGGILHFGSVRLRITGDGSLISSLVSLDDSVFYQMPEITMLAATAKEPLILGNFSQQRAYYEGHTELLGEDFNISKIVVFVRPIQSGYAQ